MDHDAYPYNLRPIREIRSVRRRRRRGPLVPVLACAAVTVPVLAGIFSGSPREAERIVAPAPSPDAPGPAATEPGALAWMLDPTPALGDQAAGLRRHVRPGFTPAAAPAAQVVAAIARPEPAAASLASPPAPAVETRIALAVPMPPQRPAELRRTLAPQALPSQTPRLAARTDTTPTRAVFRAAATATATPSEEPSFFETLFGKNDSKTDSKNDRPATVALAYADIGSGVAEAQSRRRLTPEPAPAAPVATGGTAVYDITAGTVTLPSGEVLEAHSGLGAARDNPSHAHLRMRGPTPPGTYDLTERERLFHGVRAIRLNPVGGSGAIHGRDGILAHTYMLGPSGASNGCVVFRDYTRFLQAYLRGEVRRMVVVPGHGQDTPPLYAGRRRGRASWANAD